MADEKEKSGKAAATAAPEKKRKRFVGGDYDLKRFGVTTDEETYKQGYVASEDVRELLDEFGLHAHVHIDFPFQHILKRNQEQWSLRIEPAQPHQMGATHTVAHHWVYKREIPESMAGSN